MIIYCITNKINGKMYIGQTTKSVSVRWRQHCDESRSSHLLIHRAIRKYGKENFSIDVIDVAESISELCEKERYFIREIDTLAPNGYNIAEGGNVPPSRLGTVGPNRDRKFSDSWRMHMSDSHRGKMRKSFTDEHRLRLSVSMRGRTFSDDHRRKLSEAKSRRDGREVDDGCLENS